MEMNYNHNHRNGGGVGGNGSLSNTSSSSDLNHSSSSNSISLLQSNSNSNSNSRFNHQNYNNNHHNHNQLRRQEVDSDPMQSWWESVSKARSRIQTLISLLPSDPDSLSSLVDSDRPGRSLLDSHAAYTSVSASLTGSGDDPLCQWLYDTFQLSSEEGGDSDLLLVVMSFVPLLAGLYLSRVHAASTTTPTPGSPSLAGFEAVLLAIYSAQTKSRAGKPVIVSIPTPAYLAYNPSLYHHVSSSKSPTPLPPREAGIGVGVLCPPLEPQVGIKSTKRALIIGVAFHCFYTHISQMPSWSKIELCRFAASWAGHHCPCSDALSLDEDDNNLSSSSSENEDGVKRIPLPWEVLQPMLRILGHCLMAPPPLVSDDIKDVASLAVKRLYARASHDLSPQAILATRGLVQLHSRAQAAAKAAVLANASSNGTTPTSIKKSPEMLLVSQ